MTARVYEGPYEGNRIESWGRPVQIDGRHGERRVDCVAGGRVWRWKAVLLEQSRTAVWRAKPMRMPGEGPWG